MIDESEIRLRRFFQYHSDRRHGDGDYAEQLPDESSQIAERDRSTQKAIAQRETLSPRILDSSRCLKGLGFCCNKDVIPNGLELQYLGDSSVILHGFLPHPLDHPALHQPQNQRRNHGNDAVRQPHSTALLRQAGFGLRNVARDKVTRVQ